MRTAALPRVAATDSGGAVSRADVLRARRDACTSTVLRARRGACTSTGAGDRRAARSA